MDGLGQTSLLSAKIEAIAGGGSENRQIDKLSKDFESLFVSMMLKTMRESMSEDMFAGDGSDTFGGMFDTFMGEHIAANGGIGLSNLFESKSPGSALPEHGLHHDQAVKAYQQATTLGE